MSLFNNTYIDKADQKRILDYLNGNWNVDNWNKISNIRINQDHNLWSAVIKLKPKYGFQYRLGRWGTFPDSMTLAKAIKSIASEPKHPWDDDWFSLGA